MDALCERPRVVAVGGPTATGKTALAVTLAKTFDGEIINADSMQIYRTLSIGTAKPTPQEQAGIPHHLLDFLPPEAPYSVAEYTAAGMTHRFPVRSPSESSFSPTKTISFTSTPLPRAVSCT